MSQTTPSTDIRKRPVERRKTPGSSSRRIDTLTFPPTERHAGYKCCTQIFLYRAPGRSASTLACDHAEASILSLPSLTLRPPLLPLPVPATRARRLYPRRTSDGAKPSAPHYDPPLFVHVPSVPVSLFCLFHPPHSAFTLPGTQTSPMRRISSMKRRLVMRRPAGADAVSSGL